VKRLRSTKGLTLIEVLVSLSLAGVVLAAAGKLLDSSCNLAKSDAEAGLADQRVQHVLLPLSDAIRRGSLASIRHVDGANFSSGTSDSGFQVRQVLSNHGAPVAGPLIIYRLDKPAGATEGEILRIEGPIQSVLASGVTDFKVTRSGNLFTIDVSTHAGPQDDRGRDAHSTRQVGGRNP
jgi:prepilin-type N-terminal cleavage/methylation domain-containing protein